MSLSNGVQLRHHCYNHATNYCSFKASFLTDIRFGEIVVLIESVAFFYIPDCLRLIDLFRQD